VLWEPKNNSSWCIHWNSPVLGHFFLIVCLFINLYRKRMSIIFKDSKNKIYLFSKGADSVLLDRMNKSKSFWIILLFGMKLMLISPHIPETWKNLEKYAEKGLRTLILCQKEISVPEYEKWAKKYQVFIIIIFIYIIKIINLPSNFKKGSLHFNNW